MDEIEVSSEEQESTPTPEESVSQTESEGAEQQEAAPEKEQEEPVAPPAKEVPFHEHPRFKELIEERRAYKEQLDQTRGYVEAMQRELQGFRTAQTQKPEPGQPKYKQLIDQVRAVNPEFADFQEKILTDLEEAKKEAAAAKVALSRLDAYEQREFQTAAESKLSSLMESNKIPAPLRTRYDREVRYLANQEESQGKRLNIKDVERLFKTVHEEYTPFIEGIKRESLKGYVKDKQGDKTPAPATGGAAVVPSTAKIKAGDTESLVKWLGKELRAAKKL